MDQRNDSYVPEFYTEYRYDKPILLNGSMKGITVNGFDHEDFRRKSIDANIHFQDTDVCKLIKEIIRREEKLRRAEKNE
jgi:hypothetical protein